MIVFSPVPIPRGTYGTLFLCVVTLLPSAELYEYFLIRLGGSRSIIITCLPRSLQQCFVVLLHVSLRRVKNALFFLALEERAFVVFLASSNRSRAT